MFQNVIFLQKHFIFAKPLFIRVAKIYCKITQSLYLQGFAKSKFANFKIFLKINSISLSRHKTKTLILKNNNILITLITKLKNIQTE